MTGVMVPEETENEDPFVFDGVAGDVPVGVDTVVEVTVADGCTPPVEPMLFAAEMSLSAQSLRIFSILEP